MNYLTGKSLPRRTFLRGAGATIALPFLDAMVPASVLAKPTADDPTRLVAIEIVHGAAGSNKYGRSQHLWSPEQEGADFDLSKGALSSLEPVRDYVTIVSDCDVEPAEARTAREIGGDHFRSSAAFLTQSYPKQTESSDVFAGTSFDQMYAQRFGQDTPIHSMQLCIETVDQAGGCAYGYACVYTDTISWASPTEPLPMTRDPRIVFDQLFGAGGTPEGRVARQKARQSVLDFIGSEVSRLKTSPGCRGRAADGPLHDRHPRDGAADRAHRGTQHQRRTPRASRRPFRGAGLLRRARENHVRPAGARLPVGHDPGVQLQAGPGRLQPGVSGTAGRPPPSIRRRTTGTIPSGSRSWGGSTGTT